MTLPSARALRRGVPVFGFRPRPDAVPISVLRLGGGHPPHGAPHIHDFPMLQLCAVDGGHEARVVAAGAVVDPTPYARAGDASAVLFDPVVLGVDGGPSDWSTHPLLAVFAHRTTDGVLRLAVPDERAASWRAAFDDLAVELGSTDTGADAAAIAHLTLILVDLARLAMPHLDARGPGDPLVRAAGSVIEARFGEPISLADVAASLAVSPGHLATTVRVHTGRSVVQWITDRRMVAARSALTETRAPIAQIARAVGYSDPAYFARVFRRRHSMSARAWRDAANR